jgi:hypothetical protein
VVARRSHRWSARVSREIRPVEADPIAALKHEVAGTRATVVLSSHFVRYLVLPWSQALTCEEDWIAFAHHTFQSTYGAASTTGWQIRLSNTGPGRARVASAVDCALIDALRSLPEVVSIQPYLMSAFNARRRAIGGKAAWFVLQEATRLTVALIAEGEWQLVRTRQANGDWHAALPALLDRESALSGSSPCERLVVCSEEEPPPRAERYEIVDLTLPRGANASLRQYAMTSH